MRKTLRSSRARFALAAGTGASTLLVALALLGASDVRSGDRLSFALTGGRVIAAPGRTFERGVVVVRGGVIESVGAEGQVSIPADARVLDLKGQIVHAAFIDPHVSADRLAGRKPRGPSDEEEPSEERTPPPRRTRGAAGHPLASVHAEERVLDSLNVVDGVSDSYRRLGYAVVAAAPTAGILRGREAIVSLADGPISGRVLVAEGSQVVGLDPERFDFANFGRAGYPVSKMGAVALVRQSFLDAGWWGEAEEAYSRHPAGQARPRFVAANAALLPAARGREPVVFEASDVLSLLRAFKIAREMKLRARFVGAGDEYRLRDLVAAEKPDLVLRVDFPRPYKVSDEVEWLDVPLERLRAIDRAPSNPKWMRDAGVSFSFTTWGLENPEDLPGRVREAIARGLSRSDALAAVTTIPARQLGLGDRLGEIAAGRIANLVVETGEPFAAGSRVSEIWIDGKRYEVPKKDSGSTERPHPGPLPEGEGERPDVRGLPARDDGPVAAPKAVVVRHTTVWTQGKAGILEDADLVVSGGKVVAVGAGGARSTPAGALEIDGRGKHVTPGIVDAHSHTAIDGQVNEATHAVTAEVRMRDVLDPFEPAIYRELAGGTTAANVLHGSANAIGGQNVTVKWRRGGGPDDLILTSAPEGIKFALGENPKRSNFQAAPPRYPQTRMGVAAQIRERFLAARDYRRRQEEYRKASGVKGASVVPPQPDLQLEAIAEILEGKRKIHCHSYVKSEILQMIRTAEEFGVKIATFQHTLEGYKIADEIAKHGAGASIFSDWWAYKFEVYDAIPYAGPLLHERGVLVSYNSDSDELARRLNTEAAKAVKYGAVPPAEALAFVTSNAAKQLGIFDRTGSLEPGKDADFVVWSEDPLSSSTVALETWIEGKKYFDRAADLARRPALERERADLVAKAKKVLDRGAKPEGEKTSAPPQPPPPQTTRPPEEPERRPTPPAGTPAPTPTPASPKGHA
jgi:imidazolonepropionase-like amidohydrolase